jgi:hypothetical protein
VNQHRWREASLEGHDLNMAEVYYRRPESKFGPGLRGYEESNSRYSAHSAQTAQSARKRTDGYPPEPPPQTQRFENALSKTQEPSHCSSVDEQVALLPPMFCNVPLEKHANSISEEDMALAVDAIVDPIVEKVHIHVYDLSESFANLNSVALDVLGFGGVLHVGVEVYGEEFSYGMQGLTVNLPRDHHHYIYRQTHLMGRTMLKRAEMQTIIASMRRDWMGTDYDIFNRNCGTFCNAFCQALGVGSLPAWVTRFGRTLDYVPAMRMLASHINGQQSDEGPPSPKSNSAADGWGSYPDFSEVAMEAATQSIPSMTPHSCVPSSCRQAGCLSKESTSDSASARAPRRSDPSSVCIRPPQSKSFVTQQPQWQEQQQQQRRQQQQQHQQQFYSGNDGTRGSSRSGLPPPQVFNMGGPYSSMQVNARPSMNVSKIESYDGRPLGGLFPARAGGA